MVHQDKEKPGLFNFPLDPTPSLKAYKKFTEHLQQYLQMFQNDGRIISVGPIQIATRDNQPSVIAPIEMDPIEVEQCLRQTSKVLIMAIENAKEAMHWTRKIICQARVESPNAEGRIRFLESFVENIQRILNEHKGFAWHPECYKYVFDLYRQFMPGEPGIEIQITVTVIV